MYPALPSDVKGQFPFFLQPTGNVPEIPAVPATAEELARPAVPAHTMYAYVYKPFAPAELMAWKSTLPPYRTDLSPTHKLCETIFATHLLGWQDINHLLRPFLLPEEQAIVLRHAKWLARMAHLANPREVPGPEEAVPDFDPQWNLNLESGAQCIAAYKEHILNGLQQGLPKDINMSRPYEIKQELEETPGALNGLSRPSNNIQILIQRRRES